MSLKKLISHSLPVFIFAVLAAGSSDNEPAPPDPNEPAPISWIRSSRIELGAEEARKGNFDDAIYWLKQGKSELEEWKDYDNDHFEEENMSEDITEINTMITDIERQKKAANEDSLDEVNEELKTFNFDDNDDNDLDNPNKYIYQEPTITTPGSSYDAPGSSYDGEW